MTTGRRALAVTVLALGLAAAGCNVGAATSAAPTVQASAQSLEVTPPSLEPTTPPEPTPIPIWTGCDSPSQPCEFTAGTYQTYGRWAFLPGLTMSIPDGWKSAEQDAGEFNLINPDFPEGSGLFFWRDVIPVEPDGTHIATVPSTVAGITDWLRANPQLVLTDPVEKVIGKGLATTTFVVEVAKGAVNNDAGCATVQATCFPILTDPAHWGGGWTVASFESSRYYLATIGPVTNRHLLVVALVTRTPDRLRFENAVAPILDSLDVSNVTFN